MPTALTFGNQRRCRPSAPVAIPVVIWGPRSPVFLGSPQLPISYVNHTAIRFIFPIVCFSTGHKLRQQGSNTFSRGLRFMPRSTCDRI
jgi:hypothetical protein